MKGLQAQPGVKAYLIINSDGIPIKQQGMDYNRALHLSAVITDLTAKSQQYFRELMERGENDIENIRLMTSKHEVIVAPGKDYSMIVLQEPHKEADAAGESKAKGEAKAES